MKKKLTNTWFLPKTKPMEHKSDGDTVCCWGIWNGPQRPGKKTRRNGNQRKKWDHPDHDIVKIG